MSVLIVGGGPAGAATALLLARAGIPVTLVERERDFGRVFRGEGLMPSGVQALYEMKLGHLLGKLPSRKLESWDVYIEGTRIMSVPEPIDELGDLAVRVVPQAEFLEAVVEEASQHPSFRLERGVTLRDLLRDDAGRVIGARVQSDDGSREIAADLVIGCDGRASAVRKRAGLELELLPESYDVLWFKLPAPERLRERCIMMLMAAPPREAAACYTSWDGRLQYALMLEKGAYAQLRNSDWVSLLQRTAPDWLAEHLPTVRDEIEGPVLLDVIVGRCASWSAPGLLTIGDAAHPMSPIRAQGINVALRDAIEVANHLVPAFRDGASAHAIDAATTAVQTVRQPEIVRSQTLQLRDARGFNTRAAPFLIGLAKWIGGPLGRFRWAQNAWLSAQKDLRFGSTDVRLRV